MNTNTKKSSDSVKKLHSTTTKNSETENPDLGNVDKIRDILFGNQMREFERKFTHFEKRLASDLAAIRKDNTTQIESLQTFIEGEIEILSSRLSGEEKARIDKLDDLDGEIKKQVKHIDNKIADVGTSLDKQSRDINQKILKQSQDFSTEMNNQFKDARDLMDSHKQELATGKVDKLALSEMLNSLALQINADESGQG